MKILLLAFSHLFDALGRIVPFFFEVGKKEGHAKLERKKDMRSWKERKEDCTIPFLIYLLEIHTTQDSCTWKVR